MYFGDFEEKNVSSILDLVTPAWSSPDENPDFRRFYAECIVRHNIWDAQYKLQLTDEKRNLLAACFASTKDAAKLSLKHAEEWIAQKTDCGKKLSERQEKNIKVCKSYLKMMEEKTFSYMTDDDIQLSLFISLQKGAGYPLYEKLRHTLSKKYKNIYLWTDVECNFDWYFRRGFELVEKEVYAPFSEQNRPYYTFVFRQKLLN